MASSGFAGPVVNFGYKADPSGGPPGDNNPQAAPILSYQGSAVLDPRYPYSGSNGGHNGIGAIPAHLDTAAFVAVDAIPWTASATAIAAAATATSGTKMTLISASGAGMFVNIPIVPFGQAITAANVVKVIMCGPGTSSCTTTSSSASVTSVKNRQIAAGMWVCIPDASSAGTPLIAQVLSVAATSTDGTNTLTLSTAAGASVTNGTIFLMDPSGTCVVPTIVAGAGVFFDPGSALTRGTSVTSNNAGDTGWTVTVRGYDVFGVAMTETISVSANSVAYGKKAFKSIVSVTPTNTGSTSGTLSIGTSDVFGFNYRSDFWEYEQIAFGGASNTANTGWTAADGTLPATATTGDVRGTQQFGTVGGGSGFGSNASNGTAANIASGTGRRLVAFINIPARSMLASNYASSTALFGVAQYGG